MNLKTEAGVRQFEAIATDSADLVLEFGGALSGEHGDGLVRSPFMEKMFGAEIYGAFQRHQAHVRSRRPLQSRQDRRRAAAHRQPALRRRTIERPARSRSSTMPRTAGSPARSRCAAASASAARRSTARCARRSWRRATKRTRRAAAPTCCGWRWPASSARAGLGDDGVKRVLDLCLECRACKTECPVGVDVARFKSEFLADYHARHGTPLQAHGRSATSHDARAVGQPRSRRCRMRLPRSAPVRWLNERLLGIDRRRVPPAWASKTVRRAVPRARVSIGQPQAVSRIFNDTFTNYYNPAVGMAGAQVLRAPRLRRRRSPPNVCCGRPLISQGLLDEARQAGRAEHRAAVSTSRPRARPIVFFEPSCLSAIREDVPALLRGELKQRAQQIAAQAMLFEELVEDACAVRRDASALSQARRAILLHGHCHQKSMGLVAPAKALLSRVPARGVDLDAGCCGMAGSFGYARDHSTCRRRSPSGGCCPPRAA